MQAGAVHDADEVGVRRPVPTPVAALGPGEVGYLIAGIKDVGEARSGETVTEAARPGADALLEGYRDPKPMVFCGLYPVDGDDFADLREASRSCGSTTPRSPTSPRRRARSASASAAASSACCTWRSCASGSSASSTSTSSPPRRRSSTACTRTDGEVVEVDNPSAHAAAAGDRRASRSRTSRSPSSRPPSTRAR